MKTLAVLLLATTLPALAGCGERDHAPADPASEARPADTLVGRKVRQAMAKARSELATGNISLDQVHVSGKGFNIDTGSRRDSGRPRAEITPGGELLIEGRKVEANAEQRALLRDYRRKIEDIAMAGMDIGVAGAELGVKAATEALRSVFSGNADDIERRVEARADAVRASAAGLCDRLPGLLATQERLAAAMPEFRPYANLERSDIDECYEDSSEGRRARMRAQARDAAGSVRDGIREGAHATAEAAGVVRRDGPGPDQDEARFNAAAEAEAASVEDAGRR